MKPRRNRRLQFVVATLPFIFACATAKGPQVTSEEEKEAQAVLLAQSWALQLRQEQRINEVGARVIQAAGNLRQLKFRFVARGEQSGLPHPESVNAWTDGENVWITRGMLRFLKNDDELAAVLGHEIAHAYRGHMDYLRTKQAVELLLGLPAAVFAGPLAADLVRLLVEASTKQFDREHEREADLYGLIWIHKGGFDVDLAKSVFQRMAIEIPDMEAGFLSSHPTSAERFVAMDKVAEALKKGLDPVDVFALKEARPEAGAASGTGR
jgi:predicted Zn-dependent protease